MKRTKSRLRELRMLRNLSQGQLAMRVGVDDTDPEDLRQDPVQATAHRGRSCRFGK